MVIPSSRRFPGHIDLYDPKDGKRESLYPAVERYKRLDWGMYVGTKSGRYQKRWKKQPPSGVATKVP